MRDLDRVPITVDPGDRLVRKRPQHSGDIVRRCRRLRHTRSSLAHRCQRRPPSSTERRHLWRKRMKLLVATDLTQGFAPNDFHACVEGELVMMQEPCAIDRSDPDGGCGCGGPSPGSAPIGRPARPPWSRDLDLSLSDVRAAVVGYLESAGWLTLVTEPDRARLVDEVTTSLVLMGDDFPEGTVLTRRLDYLVPRPRPPFRASYRAAG